MNTCPALPAPSNGTRLGCPWNATMYYDTVCQFSCNDGYIGSGSQARRCQHNGTWSGQDFTCQSTHFTGDFIYYVVEECLISSLVQTLLVFNISFLRFIHNSGVIHSIVLFSLHFFLINITSYCSGHVFSVVSTVQWYKTSMSKECNNILWYCLSVLV